jgi:hypothetical protein
MSLCVIRRIGSRRPKKYRISSVQYKTVVDDLLEEPMMCPHKPLEAVSKPGTGLRFYCSWLSSMYWSDSRRNEVCFVSSSKKVYLVPSTQNHANRLWHENSGEQAPAHQFPEARTSLGHTDCKPELPISVWALTHREKVASMVRGEIPGLMVVGRNRAIIIPGSSTIASAKIGGP